MRLQPKIAALVIALALAGATRAGAADFCVDSGGNRMVLKGFILPARGKCKDYRGYFSSGEFWLRGTACASTDDSRITFFHDGFRDDGLAPFTDKFWLARQTLAGSGAICGLDVGSGAFCATGTYQRSDCGQGVLPVP